MPPVAGRRRRPSDPAARVDHVSPCRPARPAAGDTQATPRAPVQSARSGSRTEGEAATIVHKTLDYFFETMRR